MELMHDFQVDVPIDQAWEVLTDLERIAPCMPGAQLLEVEGDEYRGIVKVKVGPITAQYRGTARFTELDPSAHKAVVRAEGRDTRGQGTAAATVVATLDGGDAGTSVHIETDLDISGKVAQFGRGMLAEVSEKLLGQFVQQLESNVLAGPTGNGADATGSAPAGSGGGDATTETAKTTGESETAEAAAPPGCAPSTLPMPSRSTSCRPPAARSQSAPRRSSWGSSPFWSCCASAAAGVPEGRASPIDALRLSWARRCSAARCRREGRTIHSRDRRRCT